MQCVFKYVANKQTDKNLRYQSNIKPTIKIYLMLNMISPSLDLDNNKTLILFVVFKSYVIVSQFRV